jgi:hypothetical protein
MEHKIFFFIQQKENYFGKTRNRKWKIEFSLKIFYPNFRSILSLIIRFFFKKKEPK